jgi:hypothetical protein
MGEGQTLTIYEGSHRLAWDANDNPTWEGWAVRKNADTAGSVWKIKKYIWVTGSGGKTIMVRELWADGNQCFDNSWINYSSLTYL